MPETWHYLENQFEVVTRERRGLAEQIRKNHRAKIVQAVESDPWFAELVTALDAAGGPWAAKYAKWMNARAAHRGATQALENLFAELTVKPVGGDRSKLEGWEAKVRAHWSPGHPHYDGLWPQRRGAFTTGSIDARIGEVRRLGGRLARKSTELAEAAQQPGAPAEGQAELQEQSAALAALAPRVEAFAGRMEEARAQQTRAGGLVTQLGAQLEPLRVALCVALYANLGGLMRKFAGEQTQVAGFFEVSLITRRRKADDDAGEEREEVEGSASADVGEGGGDGGIEEG